MSSEQYGGEDPIALVYICPACGNEDCTCDDEEDDD
jgi:hypothetical protein